jgi:hypothetical protein
VLEKLGRPRFAPRESIAFDSACLQQGAVGSMGRRSYRGRYSRYSTGQPWPTKWAMSHWPSAGIYAGPGRWSTICTYAGDRLRLDYRPNNPK